MDNNKIIEEIDIIVRAKVEEVKKDLQRITKETSKMVDSIQKEFKSMNDKNYFEGVSDSLKNAKSECKNVQKEARKVFINGQDKIINLDNLKEAQNQLRKIKITMDGVSFDYTPEKGDFNEKYNQAILSKEKEEKDEGPLNALGDPADTKYEVTIPKANTKAFDDSINSTTNSAKQQFELLENNLKNFDTLTIREQIKTIGMQMYQTIPIIKQSIDEMKSRLNDSSSLLGQVKVKVQEFGVGFGKIRENIRDAFLIKTDGIYNKLQSIKQKIGEVSPIAQNVGKVTKNSFLQVKDSISKPIGKIGEFINKIRNAGTESEKTKNRSKGLSEIGKSFSNGIKSIRKFALSLLSVRGAFTAISRAAQQYLSFDTQLSASIQNCWNVLGSLLAPVIEYVVGLFTKLVSVVATFVKALTGIDLVARANAKALDKQAKSTKGAASASKQLSGIDDIDNLSSGSGGGGGSDFTPITTDSIDMSPFEAMLDKIRGILSDIFKPFKEAWELEGANVIESMKFALEGIKETAKSIGSSFMEVWTNGTGTEFVSNWLITFQEIFNLIGNIGTALSEAWNNNGAGTDYVQSMFDSWNAIHEAINVVLDDINSIASNGTFTTIFSDAIEFGTMFYDSIEAIADAFTHAWQNGDSGKGILQAICDIFNDIQKFANEIIDSILQWVVSPEFQEALDKIFKGIEDIFNIAKDVCDWLLEMYSKYVKPVIDDKLIPALNSIINAIMDIWNTVKPVVDEIIKIIKNLLEPVIKGLMGFIGGIIDIIKGIADFISGVFTGDWRKAWNGIKSIVVGIWNSIWSVISGIINTIIAGFESMINIVIKGLNSILKPLRNLGNSVLKAVGIKNFSFEAISTVKLPRLATGDVAYEETHAIIGEYPNARHDPEIVSPVSMMKMSFRDVLSEFMFEGNGTRIDKLCINVAGENFYDDAIDYINDKSERNGVSVIKEVE